MASWSAFDEFDGICDQYLPSRGEGDTMAEQIVTAINKLIYRWFNDGDVYDNSYTIYRVGVIIFLLTLIGCMNMLN